MKYELAKKMRASEGFTLLELLVVLLILAGLAGILVPMLPSMIQRTHGASGASNVNEIAKFIQTHEMIYGQGVSGYDSLIDENGSTIVPAGVTLLNSGDLEYARAADALASAGIVTTYQHLSTSTNKTFDPYNGKTVEFDGTGATPSGRLVILTTGGIGSGSGEAELNLPTSGTGTGIAAYVAFGVGARTNMVGKSMVDAPVHFPERGNRPEAVYCRFLAVYAIPETDGPARLASICAAHDDGLSGLGGHLGEYFESLPQ